jgi:hypothetical protein
MSEHTVMALAWVLIAGNLAMIGVNGILLRKNKQLNQELGRVLALWKARTDAIKDWSDAGHLKRALSSTSSSSSGLGSTGRSCVRNSTIEP